MWDPADSPLRVLVVDDNTDTALSLAWLLQSYGHETRVVHDGLGAVAAAPDFRPHAVILDLGLPDLDGFEVARRLRALPEGSDVLLVASTGYNRERDRAGAAAAGFDHYLVKPFDARRLDQLLGTLRRADAVLA